MIRYTYLYTGSDTIISDRVLDAYKLGNIIAIDWNTVEVQWSLIPRYYCYTCSQLVTDPQVPEFMLGTKGFQLFSRSSNSPIG